MREHIGVRPSGLTPIWSHHIVAYLSYWGIIQLPCENRQLKRALDTAANFKGTDGFIRYLRENQVPKRTLDTTASKFPTHVETLVEDNPTAA